MRARSTALVLLVCACEPRTTAPSVPEARTAHEFPTIDGSTEVIHASDGVCGPLAVGLSTGGDPAVLFQASAGYSVARRRAHQGRGWTIHPMFSLGERPGGSVFATHVLMVTPDSVEFSVEDSGDPVRGIEAIRSTFGWDGSVAEELSSQPLGNATPPGSFSVEGRVLHAQLNKVVGEAHGRLRLFDQDGEETELMDCDAPLEWNSPHPTPSFLAAAYRPGELLVLYQLQVEAARDPQLRLAICTKEQEPAWRQYSLGHTAQCGAALAIDETRQSVHVVYTRHQPDVDGVALVWTWFQEDALR